MTTKTEEMTEKGYLTPDAFNKKYRLTVDYDADADGKLSADGKTFVYNCTAPDYADSQKLKLQDDQTGKIYDDDPNPDPDAVVTADTTAVAITPKGLAQAFDIKVDGSGKYTPETFNDRFTILGYFEGGSTLTLTGDYTFQENPPIGTSEAGDVYYLLTNEETGEELSVKWGEGEVKGHYLNLRDPESVLAAIRDGII